MKKLTKTIIALIFIISISFNIFYFGNEYLKKEKAKAFNQGVIYTFQRASEIGEVSLKTEQGNITLEIKK